VVAVTLNGCILRREAGHAGSKGYLARNRTYLNSLIRLPMQQAKLTRPAGVLDRWDRSDFRVLRAEVIEPIENIRRASVPRGNSLVESAFCVCGRKWVSNHGDMARLR
jgi:hypothetical protein